MLTRRVSITLASGFLALGLLPLAPAAAEAPAPGTCWPLTDRQWDRSSLPNVAPVDCAAGHTAEAMGSVAIPARIARGSTKRLWAWAFKKCQTVGVTYIWGNDSAPLPVKSYALPTTAQLATYIPTRAQWRRGERWVSCVGFNTTVKGVARTRDGSVAFSGLEPQQCVSTKSWKWQSCSAPKSARLTNVVWLSNALKYPGTPKAVAKAKRKCQALASSRGQRAQTWYVRGKGSWNYGNHFGYCEIVEKTSV